MIWNTIDHTRFLNKVPLVRKRQIHKKRQGKRPLLSKKPQKYSDRLDIKHLPCLNYSWTHLFFENYRRSWHLHHFSFQIPPIGGAVEKNHGCTPLFWANQAHFCLAQQNIT